MTDELSFIDKNILNDIVIENTYKFASEIDGNIEILKKGLFTPEVEGSDQKFRDFVMNDMHSKYGKNPNSLIVKRIKRELDIIINKGYSVIY
jgi:DNA polymerase-3 subunit alpha (Gram-positive type)